MGELLVAVDVGTGSARAGVLSSAGHLLGRAEHPIAMRRTSATYAEHDSSDIWRAVVTAVRGAMRVAAARPEDIAAIGFDATCSLVVRSAIGAPLPVAVQADARWDTIVWLDHRAMAEAEECTATVDPVLSSLGGVMSPETQLPKLMWLKRHLPETWQQTGLLFDLGDFLTWKASGSLSRSQSSLACKWGWGAGGSGHWDTRFLSRIGLADLLERGGLPIAATPPGTDLGPLSPAAASALGLTTKTRVAASLIDAHAGALGVIGVHASDPTTLDHHLCLVAGTSNSVLGLAADARPIRGVWGPYAGALLPECWLLEAGQSATGALLDHLIRWHSTGGEPDAARHQAVAKRIAILRRAEGSAFASQLHILPDFHGNRSPLAEPATRGTIHGLSLDSDFDSLCGLYWRSAVSIALGVRHNLATFATHGFATDRLLLAGGHARNDLLVRLYADVTGATVIEPNAPDAVLLGSGILAAVAAGFHPTLAGASAAMHQGGTDLTPDPKARAGFDRDYSIMLDLQRGRAAWGGFG
jgi:FGGY-family pentulose kinase